MSFHAALEAALPSGWLAPQRMDASTFCGFQEFELLSPSVRGLVAADDKEMRSLRRYPVISGHFSLRSLLKIAEASAIGTILREPRARAMSLYSYWRTPDIFDGLLPYRAHEYALMPLARFMSEPRVAAAVDNQVCRMLLDGDARIPGEGFIAEADIDSVALDAIARLDTLGFVGVLELGDDAWRGLARLFGVKLEPRTVNVTGEAIGAVAASSGERLFTADALDPLEQRCAADRVVYDYALAHAGLGDSERLRLTESAFAGQIARLEDVFSAGRPSSSGRRPRGQDSAVS